MIVDFRKQFVQRIPYCIHLSTVEYYPRLSIQAEKGNV